LSIVLLGLVMVTIASISIASQQESQAFYYLERQLILTCWRRGRGDGVLHSDTRCWSVAPCRC